MRTCTRRKERSSGQEAAITATELKRSILKHCRFLRPFTAPTVRAASWDAHPAEEILSDPAFFAISPKDTWHGFSHIAENLYLTDPCKVLLVTDPLPRAASFSFSRKPPCNGGEI